MTGPAEHVESLAAGPRVVEIDGIPITAVTERQTVEHVMRELRGGRGGRIMTPNADILRLLHRGPDKDLASSAEIVVADGMPVVWASKLRGTPLPGRVTGADLVWSLSEAAAAQNRSVYLLGAAPGVATRAARALQSAYPGLVVSGQLSPPMGFDDDPRLVDEIAAAIRAAAPDLVFVALGFPRQERLSARLLRELPGSWFLGCGGALDMAAGDTPRASPAVQALGAEWLHRLALQPRRLGRRYLVDDLPFVLGMLARAARDRVRLARSGSRTFS